MEGGGGECREWRGKQSEERGEWRDERVEEWREGEESVGSGEGSRVRREESVGSGEGSGVSREGGERGVDRGRSGGR